MVKITKKILKNKAQVKIQQTAFMLIALTVLFVLVFLFYITFKSASLNKDAETLREKNAVQVASRLASTPEFSCEQAYGTPKTYCVDFDKAFILSKNPEIYEDFWEINNIEIRKLYPIESEEVCTDSNYPHCNYIKIFDKPIEGADHSAFVTICHKEFTSTGRVYNKCELGKLIVRYDLR
jgi:hypothetical protein